MIITQVHNFIAKNYVLLKKNIKESASGAKSNVCIVYRAKAFVHENWKFFDAMSSA